MVGIAKIFYVFSETLIYVANTPVYMDILVLSYSTISKIPTTGPGPPNTPESLTHIDCYIYDFISAVQGGPYRQHRVFDGTVRALKRLLL